MVRGLRRGGSRPGLPLYTYKEEKDERSVIRDTVGVIRKEAGKSLSQPEK
ncbi:conserved hypothetical protein [Neisseria gonorrhoeae 35/02]|nr:conserved hypothetical protein [Neisseria gonorrhoeae 35/02]